MELLSSRHKFVSSIKSLNFSIPRCLRSDVICNSIELHTFVDGSQIGYGSRFLFNHHIDISFVTEDLIDTLINSVSDFYVLRNKIAWILKVKEYLRTKIPFPRKLTVSDLKAADAALFKYIQNKHFSMEINSIQKNYKLPKISKLYKPFLDDAGLLRLGSRLSNSDLDY